MRNIFEKVYAVTVVGIRPLLQNRYAIVAGKKTSRKEEYNPEDEAKKCLCLTEDGKIFQPSTHFEASMTKEAVNYKLPSQGKKTYKDAFKAGVEVLPLEIIHKNQEYTVDVRPVVINRARVPKARPMFKEWELSFEIHVYDERISEGVLRDVLDNAGRFHGVGDYRPKFGQFEVTGFEEIK